MHWALQKQKAFTIVELLIVVVVIAILAAITIVAYNGITNRAKESSVASTAAQVQKKLSLYAVSNNDRYPATLAEAGIDSVTAANVQYSVNNTSTPAGYCVTASQSGISSFVAKEYTYTTSSAQTANQATPIVGACPGHAGATATPASSSVANPAVRTGTSGWSAISSTGGAQTGTRVTSVSGLSALGITTAYRNTLGGTPSSWWRVQSSSGSPVTEGQTYTLSGYVRPSVAATTGVIIIWENSGGATVSESPSAFAAQTAGSWARKSVTAVAPVGAVTARFHLGATNNGVAGAYVDGTAVMFYQGSTLYGYADGDSTDWIWEGAANASPSKGPAL